MSANTAKWVVSRYLEGYTKADIAKVIEFSRARVMECLTENKIEDLPTVRKEHLPELVYDESKLEVNEELRKITLQIIKEKGAKPYKRENPSKKVQKISSKKTVKEEQEYEPEYVEKFHEEEDEEKTPMSLYIQPRRLDIFYANIAENKERSHVQHGYRPVIIIQNNITNFTGTTVLCIAGTSRIKKDVPMHVTIPASSGVGILEDTCFMCEQIFTLDQKDLRKFAGTIVNTEYEYKMLKALKIAFGILEDINVTYVAKEGNKLNIYHSDAKENQLCEKVTKLEPVPVTPHLRVAENVENMDDGNFGTKGLLYLKCPQCGVVANYFLHDRANEIECRYCKKDIPIVNIPRFEYSCDCYDTKFVYGRTNITESFSKVCGNKGCTKKYKFVYDATKKSYIGTPYVLR